MTRIEKKTNMTEIIPLLFTDIQEQLNNYLETCPELKLRNPTKMESDTGTYIHVPIEKLLVYENIKKETFEIENHIEYKELIKVRSLAEGIQFLINDLIFKCSQKIESQGHNIVLYSFKIDHLDDTLVWVGNYYLTTIFDPHTGYVFRMKVTDDSGIIKIILKMELIYYPVS
jgi:RNA-binding protein YhbY